MFLLITNFVCVTAISLDPRAEKLVPFVTHDYQHPCCSTLVPFGHQGNKSLGRKWRENEEIMWENNTWFSSQQEKAEWAAGQEQKCLSERETNSNGGKKSATPGQREVRHSGRGVSQNINLRRGTRLLREPWRYMKVLGEQLKQTD